MDLEALRVFVRVAELGSYTRASEQLGLSRARASVRLQQLEAALGARLLHRTTRAVRLTEDGEQLLPRARRLLHEAEELGAMFTQAPRGRVRLDLPARLGREIVIPRLPELLASAPGLELLVSTTDRRVDVVREGFDCVVRIGAVGDAGLVARRLGELPMVSCASAGYLRRHGTPRALDELSSHWLVGYSPALGGPAPAFEAPGRGGYRQVPMRSLVTVNGSDAYYAACLAGLGIIQVPRLGARAALAAGDLVEILPEFPSEPMPVFLVQPHRRPRRPVRAVMRWLEQVLAPHLG